MAKNNTQAAEQPEGAAVAAVATQETPQSISKTEYTAEEFAAAARVIFGNQVTPDCVTAAFRMANIAKATKGQAKEIVSKYLKKEVK